MSIKNVTVAGSGVLGSQIAFQSAFHGFNLIIYDINDEVIATAKKRVEALQADYEHDLNATPAEVKAAFDRVSYSTDLAEAAKDADLIVEAIPENVKIKQSFYQQLAPLLRVILRP